MKRRKLTIGFDVDDTLAAFTQAICKRCEEKFKHPFPFEEVVWGFSNYKEEETAFVHALFRDPDFIKSVPMFDGMIEMLREVVERGHDILFVTSTYSNVMTTRALWLFDAIDFIHPRNYVMTGRKDCVQLDMLFDDCADHILNSIAKVPVLVNTPWNQTISGHIRVNGGKPEEYLTIIDLVEQGYTKQDIYRMQNPTKENDGSSIIVIVGPSTGGKTVVTQSILNMSDQFEKLVTNTTRDPRPGEVDEKDYNFTAEDNFRKMIATNSLLEYTEYAGNYYGTSKAAVDTILKKQKNVIAIMDIEGAMAMKQAYPENTYTVFLSREKEDLISSILERDVPMADKVKRIAQLDADFSSERRCDYSILNKEIEDTANQIIGIFA